jgi:capsular exopolysaccharide synthesis family protein
VADAAAAFLHPPPASPGSLVSEVSVSPNTNTGFLTISAQDHDPQRAAAIANAFASALASHQTAQENHNLDEQIHAVVAQLAVIPKSNPAARAPFLQQVAALKALRGATGAGAQIIERAAASATPVGPKTRRAEELAAVIGLLLGLGAVLAAESSDRRLRTPADLESLTGWPLLGVVPRSAFSAKRLTAPREEEAFQMLCAALTYFNVDPPLASVVIASPLMADGKTTVAAGLAVAIARAGKRAILVDADLRHPQVGVRLGLEPSAGLGEVLAGERQLSEVLLDYPIDAPGSGSLFVLPAGPPSPNPSALISSPQMSMLLRQLESQSDLVIVDTAAALAVSDSLPLVQSASGVVMVVRMNRSSRVAVRRLQKMIVSAHGHVVGVVATGSDGGRGGYGYYYKEQRRGPLRRRLGLRRRRSAPPTAARPVGPGVVLEQEAVVKTAAPPVAPVPVAPVVPLVPLAPLAPLVPEPILTARPPASNGADQSASNGADQSARELAADAARAARPIAAALGRSWRKRLGKDH